MLVKPSAATSQEHYTCIFTVYSSSQVHKGLQNVQYHLLETWDTEYTMNIHVMYVAADG